MTSITAMTIFQCLPSCTPVLRQNCSIALFPSTVISMIDRFRMSDVTSDDRTVDRRSGRRAIPPDRISGTEVVAEVGSDEQRPVVDVCVRQPAPRRCHRGRRSRS